MEMCNSPVASASTIAERSVPNAAPWLFTTPTTMIPAPPTEVSGSPDPSSSSAAATAQLMMMMSAASYGQFGFLPGSPGAGGPPGLVLPPPGGAPPVPQIVKETIQLKGAIMQPPNPSQSQPPTRERPPGCRTVFVGGLPEKATEEHLRELFERCGEIHSLRMSKKNFAHIRFVSQDCVDRALYFSGYRLKVEDRSDKEYCGKIHVDFAQARDDQYEFECAQRALLREQRHRDRSGSLSPSEIQHYSDHEAGQLLEKLKVAESLASASLMLISWLDKGECNKRSSTQFYSMIATVNAHVRRLIQEKQQFDSDLAAFKEKHKHKLQTLMTQFSQIEKVFRSAKKQRNWDHFTKAQRKNLDIWLKQAEFTENTENMDIRKHHENDMLRDRQEENMETSDDEETSPSVKRPRIETEQRASSEVDRLKAELDTSREEIELLKTKLSLSRAETDTSGQKDFTSQGCDCADPKRKELESELAAMKRELAQTAQIRPKEAKLIALASAFLNIHPCGASLGEICAYLRKIVPHLETDDAEAFLQKYSELFLWAGDQWKLAAFKDMCF